MRSGGRSRKTHPNDVANQGRYKHIVEFYVLVLQYVLENVHLSIFVRDFRVRATRPALDREALIAFINESHLLPTFRLPRAQYSTMMQMLGGSVHAPINAFRLSCLKSRIWKWTRFNNGTVIAEHEGTKSLAALPSSALSSSRA